MSLSAVMSFYKGRKHFTFEFIVEFVFKGKY